MKKKLVIIIIVFFTLVLISILTHKKETKFDRFTSVEVKNNPFDFGIITKNDTVKHVFKIKNITKTLFVIEKVMPSCTCTVTKTNKNKCNINESTNIEVVFIPKPNQTGKIKTVVFVQCNAEKGIIKLELTGKII